MGAADDSQLVAVILPAPEAATAVRRVWDRGAAVGVLDPDDPRIGERLAALDPTRIVDRDGERAVTDGRGVRTGVGAVVATSGTTGRARLVELERTALEASARAVHAALDVDPARDHWLACVPLHHVAGLAIVARAYFTDTALTVHPRFDAAAVAGAAVTCTLVSVVPTTLRRLLAADAARTASFRRVLVGGAPVPAAVRADASAAGVALVTTYGLTETGGGCVHDGHALAGVDVAVAPDSGEIRVRGPVLLAGYRATTADPAPLGADLGVRDGWLATGDVGRFDAAGRLEVVDRLKDLVITGGVNVSPAAVEARLVGAPGVGDVAVAGAPDIDFGERVVAWVVPTDTGLPPSLEALRDFGTRAGLRRAELPREVRIVAVIPRTPSGKVRRAELRTAGEG